MGNGEELSQLELESLVAHYFCQGNKPGEIPKLLQEHNGVAVNSSRIWKILAAAARARRFRYIPASETGLGESLKNKYNAAGLNRVEVVSSLLLGDLAYRTAEVLLDVLREHYRNRDEVHIGFAGGGTLLEVARAFSELLRDPRRTNDVPRRLVFHSMVAGWNVDEPEKDPNSFSAILAGTHAVMDFNIRFVGLHVPGIVRIDMYDTLRELDGIREAFEVAGQIDVIVTSAGRWECRHSELYRLYEKYAETTLTELDQAGCVGDLMWCPLGSDGQIDPRTLQTTIQAFTLMSIDKLHDFICTQGKQVILALGPCSGCGEPKTQIFETIAQLAPTRRFVTHLVCDCRTARRLVI